VLAGETRRGLGAVKLRCALYARRTHCPPHLSCTEQPITIPRQLGSSVQRKRVLACRIQPAREQRRSCQSLCESPTADAFGRDTLSHCASPGRICAPQGTELARPVLRRPAFGVTLNSRNRARLAV
jgi:hypothetical protein